MSNRTVTPFSLPASPESLSLSRSVLSAGSLTPVEPPPSQFSPVPESLPLPQQMIPVNRSRPKAGLFSLRHVQDLAARLFPHTTGKVMCPPGPLPTGPLPPLIVSSLMRTGTHLLIDLLLNNIQGYRQSPLYLDFDAYTFEGFASAPLLEVGSCVVKTHVAHRPFNPETGDLLRALADRSVVIIPMRQPEKIYKSMATWGYQASPEEFAGLQARHLAFWKGHDPILVEFDHLLNPEKAAKILALIRDRAGLPPDQGTALPFVAGSSRARNLFRKLRTRIQGCKAPRFNTTVGFKL